MNMLNNLYRTTGERAVRAGSPDHAARLLADRMARRAHGRRGAAHFVSLIGRGENGEALHYAARLINAYGWATSVQFVVRRA